MLWPQRPGSHHLALAACVFFALPTVIYFGSSTDHAFSSKLSPITQSTSSPAFPSQDNFSLIEQMDQNGVRLFNNAMEGGPRIRQASMLFGDGEKGEDAMYERAMRTHIAHGEKWGYPSHVLRKDLVGKGDWKVLVFGKLLYLQSLVVQEMARPYGKRAEWLVWFDADTIILNQNIPWEAFLPPSDKFPEINFLGNKDWNGYNCGVFFLRVNEWSVNFLTEASALPLLRPEVELGTRAPNYEQDAMVWVLEKEGYREHVVYQPREWYNPFQEGENHESEHQNGDMLIHFPGMQEKHAAMGTWLDKVDQSPEELQVPVSNLTLKADIAHFWTRLNNARVQLDKAWELQTTDKIKQMFIHNPDLGDQLKDAADHLHRIFQESPYEKDNIRKAYSELIDAIRKTEDAKKQVQEARKAEAKAKLQQAKDREKHGGESNALDVTNNQAEAKSQGGSRL